MKVKKGKKSNSNYDVVSLSNGLLKLDYLHHIYNTKEASSLSLDYLLHFHTWKGASSLTQVWLHTLLYQ